MNEHELIQARKVNWNVYQKALAALEQGWDEEAFEAFSASIKNMTQFEKLKEDGKAYHHEHHEHPRHHDYHEPMAPVVAPVATDNHMAESHMNQRIKAMSTYFDAYSHAKDVYRHQRTEVNKAAMLEPMGHFFDGMMGLMKDISSNIDCEGEKAAIRAFMEKMRGLNHV